MKRKIWLLLLISSSFLFQAACGPPIGGPPLETGTVAEVLDGDTIVLATGQHVRYIGIDAPEVRPEAERFGQEAWSLNSALVARKKVTLERNVSDTDQYGRLLRYVYVDNIFVNGEMVRRGLARAKAYPPDTKYQRYLEGLEEVARGAERGMWAK